MSGRYAAVPISGMSGRYAVPAAANSAFECATKHTCPSGRATVTGVNSEGPVAATTVLPDGSVRAPDGTVYRRTDKRVRRKLGDLLVADGSPIVTSVFPEGHRWHQGTAATAMWDQIKPRLVETKRPPVKDLQWVGHVWESDGGMSMLFFEGQH